MVKTILTISPFYCVNGMNLNGHHTSDVARTQSITSKIGWATLLT